MNFPKIPNSVYVAAVIFAILAAVCNAMDTPLKKFFTGDVGPLMIVAFLFLGSAIGIALISLFCCKTSLVKKECHVRKSDIIFLLGVTLTTLFANMCICFGLKSTSASSASVLMSFETVVTVLIALIFLHEKVSKRLWIGIIFIVLGSIALAVKDGTSFTFSSGSLLIILATLFYGIRANLSKKLSGRNPTEVTIIRGLGVFICALPIGLALGESLPSLGDAIALMLIGIVTCGCVMLFTLLAQRTLGAAKTAAIYAIYPLLGAIFAFFLFNEIPSASFIAALILILPGLYFVITKNSSDASDDEPDITPRETESPLLVNMREDAKQHARNYFVAFGFVIMALPYLYLLLFELGFASISEWHLTVLKVTLDYLPLIAPGMFLLLCSIILLILRKRALIATMFLFNSGVLIVYSIYSENTLLSVVCGIFYLIFALILLTAKEKQKYLLSAVNILCAAGFIAKAFATEGITNVIYSVIQLIVVLFLLYLAVASAAERNNIPLKKYIVYDNSTPINKTGSMVGYLYIALMFCSWILYDTGATGMITPLGNMAGITVINMLIVIGVILLFIGKMRMLPVLFLGLALGFLMEIGYTEKVPLVIPLLFLFLGVFSVMRKSAKLTPSIICISCAFSLMLYNVKTLYPEVYMVMLILEILCMVISLYLAFAEFSEKPNLPVF